MKKTLVQLAPRWRLRAHALRGGETTRVMLWTSARSCSSRSDSQWTPPRSLRHEGAAHFRCWCEPRLRGRTLANRRTRRVGRWRGVGGTFLAHRSRAAAPRWPRIADGDWGGSAVDDEPANSPANVDYLPASASNRSAFASALSTIPLVWAEGS